MPPSMLISQQLQQAYRLYNAGKPQQQQGADVEVKPSAYDYEAVAQLLVLRVATMQQVRLVVGYYVHVVIEWSDSRN